jgi:hypothetical protein
MPRQNETLFCQSYKGLQMNDLDLVQILIDVTISIVVVFILTLISISF